MSCQPPGGRTIAIKDFVIVPFARSERGHTFLRRHSLQGLAAKLDFRSWSAHGDDVIETEGDDVDDNPKTLFVGDVTDLAAKGEGDNGKLLGFRYFFRVMQYS